MDWDKMLKVARIPMIVLLILQMLSFVTLAHQFSYYSYLFLPVIFLSYIVPAFIYLYTGYSGVKNYNLKLGEAALTGALMSATLTIINIIITIGAYYSTVSASSTTIILLAFSIFGLVTGAIFNGFLALIGGLIAQWLTNKVEVKRNYFLIAGGVLLTILISFVIIFFVIFYFSSVSDNQITPAQCTFPPGFTCISYKLYTNGSLYLRIGQGTGKTIRVNGVTCTQNTSFDFTTNEKIWWNPTHYGVSYQPNVTMASGSSSVIADPSDSSVWIRDVRCSDSNGKISEIQPIGSVYNGRIYINYTEVETNLTRIAVGTYTVKYEA